MKKKDLTSQQIVEAAIGLFATHGIEKTSLAMIAGEVGITKPSIYYHFASKDELVERVFEYMFSDYHFDHYFSLTGLNEFNFAEQLYQGGLRMFPEEEEAFVPVMRLLNEFMLTANRNANYGQRVAAMQQSFLDGFREFMKLGVDFGLVDRQHADSKAYVLALVIDNITSYILMEIPLDYQAVWKEAVNSVLRKGADAIE
ncbi:TetR/AcrR family transcriptional regulator [Paenibacillus sp. Y412MC10]|uniref:TetR/AcrR family transcriptional regulator n=1 Tax=Geobacillus sp. (strain Y412MC10) TaxID=481743 RepID=UPI00017894B4|nr:TetR/AcrR family transcriptional regulator [Paenibacillus sp. Y412MC10]ACX63476.1 transcriptional regulator, TetR family [Paenibacillus sp. Y412MC10]